jgi:hypothetical protein
VKASPPCPQSEHLPSKRLERGHTHESQKLQPRQQERGQDAGIDSEDTPSTLIWSSNENVASQDGRWQDTSFDGMDGSDLSLPTFPSQTFGMSHFDYTSLVAQGASIFQLPAADIFPSYAPHQPDQQPSPVSPITFPCACFCETMRTLRDLRIQIMDHGTSQSLDVALAKNNTAIGKVSDVLRCTSVHDSIINMLILVLLNQSISLYQCGQRLAGDAAATAAKETSPPSISFPFPFPFDLASEAKTKTATATLPAAKITLGTFELDSDDDQSLKNRVLLVELKKVQTLLTEFKKRLRDRTGGPETFDVCGAMRG